MITMPNAGKIGSGAHTKRGNCMSTLQNPLHIDIPVQLPRLKVAFSIAALAFEGDLPASIFHLQLITQNIADWKARA